MNVIFSDDDLIDDVANRPNVRESMFLSWFEANKKFSEATELTYVEFPLKFVWKQDTKKWKKRKTSAFSIGKIFFVPPGSGELYNIRLPLNIIRGTTTMRISKISTIMITPLLEMCVMHLAY